MLGVAAQRIAWPIRKPRNNADECHCAETRRDGGFPGDLLCRTARPWGLPRASRRFAHIIPERLRRGHAGLIQRFHKMDLILWRHADAEPGEPDIGRRLTAKGLKQAERVAAWLDG